MRNTFFLPREEKPSKDIRRLWKNSAKHTERKYEAYEERNVTYKRMEIFVQRDRGLEIV